MSDPTTYGHDPYAAIPTDTGWVQSMTDTGWFGKKLLKKAKKLVKKVAKNPLVEAAMPMVEQAIKHNPWGMAGMAALGAMKSAVKGGSLKDIAKAAAHGAMPAEIEAAIGFASDAVRGKNIAKSALKRGGKLFQDTTGEKAAFNLASSLLTKVGGPDLRQLASARRLLTTEGARRAFDAAVGTVAVAAKEATTLAAPRFIASPIARQLNRVSRPRVSFRPLTARAAAVVGNRVPSATMAAMFGRRETAGLESDAKAYRVEAGDSAWAIAKKLMGDGNRWRELVKANPKKATVKTGPNAGNFATLWAGELLTLPATWAAKHASKLTADALAQARALLKLWSEADGANQAGVTNYGDKPEDSALTWGPRDRLMLVSFLNWWNKDHPDLTVNGELVDRAADALRQWASEHTASANTPALTPTPAAPSAPVMGDDPITWSPSTTTPAAPAATVAQPGADVRAVYEAAKALTDPNQIRMVAGDLERRGYEDWAAELMTRADSLEAQQFGVKDPTTQTIPLTVTGSAPPAKKDDDGAGVLLVGGLVLAKLAHIL